MPDPARSAPEYRARCDDFRVTFVTQYDGSLHNQGGLARYERSLLPVLKTRCNVDHRAIEPMKLPRVVRKGFALANRDIDAFLTNNPFQITCPSRDDLVHLTNQQLAGLLVWQRYPSGLVVTVQDIIPLVARGNEWHHSQPGVLDRIVTRRWVHGLRHADMLIAASVVTRDDLTRRLKIDPERIRVVPDAVDHTLFNSTPGDDDSRLESLRLKHVRPFVLHVGSLQPRKNIARLLRAFALARQHEPELRLVLAGSPRVDPARARQLEEEAHRLGLSGVVRSLGMVTDADLAALYRSAAVFVIPSLYEGFGLPALEAMACGCPTIASGTSSLPEVVGDAALLVNPYSEKELSDSILRVVTSTILANELRQKGKMRAALFTWERTAEATLAVYREVQTRRARGAEAGRRPKWFRNRG